jgi:hypothetical protein
MPPLLHRETIFEISLIYMRQTYIRCLRIYILYCSSDTKFTFYKVTKSTGIIIIIFNEFNFTFFYSEILFYYYFYYINYFMYRVSILVLKY